MSICESKKTETARVDNRSAFPNAASIMDLFRKAFGDDQVKLLYAEEGGRTIGKQLPRPKQFVTVEKWLNGSRLIKEEMVRRAAKPMLPSSNKLAQRKDY